MLTTFRLFTSGSVAVSQVDNSSACGAPFRGAMGTPLMPLTIRHWSSTPRSGSRMGGGADRKVAGSAGQNCSGMTPWGMYMNASRTGGFGAPPWGASAQPMVSRRGRASAAPNPRRQVRRSIRQSLRMGAPFRFVDPVMGEGIAGHDGDHERLQAIVVLGRGGGELIDDDLVVALQLPAQRVGEESGGQVAAEVVRAGRDDPFQFLRSAEAKAPRELAGGVDGAAGVVLVAPAPDGIEILQAEADGIQDLVAAGAGRIAPVEFGPLAERERRDLLGILFF